MAADRQRRLDSLTSLRFVAALLVVLYHSSRQVLPETSGFLGLGYVGVTFFFVLSGFILTWTHDEEAPKRVFYWKRFARIYPLHLLTTMAAIVFLLLTAGQISIAKLFPVLTLTQAWIPMGDWKYAYNGVSWSLSDETFFYLIFPIVALVLLRRSSRFATIVGWLASAAMVLIAGVVILVLPEITWDALTYTDPAFRLGEFLVGIALGFLVRRDAVLHVRPWIAVVVFVAGLVASYLIADVLYALPWDMPFVVSDLLVLPGVVLAIIAFAQSDLAGHRTILTTRIFVKLGEWSFALYLVHELVIHVVLLQVANDAILLRALGAAVAIVISIALAAALYTWVERPVERRLRPLVGHPRPRVETHSTY